MAEKGKHYVVLHAAVGPHAEGDVIPAEALVVKDRREKNPDPDFDAAPRLLSRGAIREATAAESARVRSGVAGGMTPPAVLSPYAQMNLQELDAEKVRQERLLGDLRDKLVSYQTLGVPAGAPEDDPQLKALLDEKAAELEGLDAAIKEAEEAVKQAEEEARKRAGEEVKPFAPVAKRRDQAASGAAAAASVPPPAARHSTPAAPPPRKEK
jgi:hypothetical protein